MSWPRPWPLGSSPANKWRMLMPCPIVLLRAKVGPIGEGTWHREVFHQRRVGIFAQPGAGRPTLCLAAFVANRAKPKCWFRIGAVKSMMWWCQPLVSVRQKPVVWKVVTINEDLSAWNPVRKLKTQVVANEVADCIQILTVRPPTLKSWANAKFNSRVRFKNAKLMPQLGFCWPHFTCVTQLSSHGVSCFSTRGCWTIYSNPSTRCGGRICGRRTFSYLTIILSSKNIAIVRSYHDTDTAKLSTLTATRCTTDRYRYSTSTASLHGT